MSNEMFEQADQGKMLLDLLKQMAERDLVGIAVDLRAKLQRAFEFNELSVDDKKELVIQTHRVFAELLPEFFGEAALKVVAEYNAANEQIIASAQAAMRPRPVSESTSNFDTEEDNALWDF